MSRAGKINDAIIRKSMVYGSIMASFTVEDFSVNRLLGIKLSDINKRYCDFKKLTRF